MPGDLPGPRFQQAVNKSAQSGGQRFRVIVADHRRAQDESIDHHRDESRGCLGIDPEIDRPAPLSRCDGDRKTPLHVDDMLAETLREFSVPHRLGKNIGSERVIFDTPAHHVPHKGHEALGNVGAIGDRVDQLFGVAVLFFSDRDDDVGLGRKIPVEGPCGHSGRRTDFLHRRLVEPTTAEASHRGLDNLTTSALCEGWISRSGHEGKTPDCCACDAATHIKRMFVLAMLSPFKHVKRKAPPATRKPAHADRMRAKALRRERVGFHTMSMRPKRFVMVTVGVLALGACSTMPGRQATAPVLPSAWSDVETAQNEAALTDWWKGFNDPALDSLVSEGLASGPSVRLAALRIKEARALSQQTLGQFLPEISGQLGGQYTRAIDGPQLTGSFQSFVAGGGTGTVVRESEQFIGSYGPQLAWEIPLFGRIEASAVGSRANTRVAVEDLRGVRAALAGDVAQAYVDYRAGQQRVAALQEAVALSRQLADIVQVGADAGFSAPADAADARRLAEATRAQLPDVVLAARQAAARLAVLRGRAPGTEPENVLAALHTVSPVPSYALSGAPAAPADLLRLRPDIAQAEARTLVAAAALGVARADLLPQIRLTGSIAVTDNLIGSGAPERLVQSQLGPSISIPLLDWGRRWSATQVRDSQFEQALVNYQSTVANAVSEASLALTSLAQGQERLDAARKAETAAEATARGVRASYGAGIANLSDRLRAEQQLIDARVTRIGAEQSQAGAAIQVYRAFGGGPPPLSREEERALATSALGTSALGGRPSDE